MRKYLFVAIGCLLVSNSAVLASPFLDRGGSFISGKGRTAAPFGAVLFCRNNPLQCSVRRARGFEVEDGRVILGENELESLGTLNRRINRRMRAAAESAAANADNWEVGGQSGDCEDFALTKRDFLIRSGYPSSSVLVAVVRTSAGKPHAVLVVRTNRGDWVMDNLSDRVSQFSSTYHHWEKMQSPSNPRMWVRL